jgi:hypothetical protein
MTCEEAGHIICTKTYKFCIDTMRVLEAHTCYACEISECYIYNQRPRHAILSQSDTITTSAPDYTS